MTLDDYKEIIDRKCIDDSSFFVVYADCLRRLRDDFYPREIVDMFFQKWDRFPLDIYDAAAFAELWGMYVTGELAIAKLPIGSAPVADSDKDGMNARLGEVKFQIFTSKDVVSLEGNVSAIFWGGKKDEDGRVDVESPIAFYWDDSMRGEGGIEFYSGAFPLEIGYTYAYKTLSQIRLGHRLARWPYGSECLYLFEHRHPFAWINNIAQVAESQP